MVACSTESGCTAGGNKDVEQRCHSSKQQSVGFTSCIGAKEEWNLVVLYDYRKLNLVTQRDAYPVPRIDATMDSLSGAKFFTTLGLASEYWEVQLEEEDKEKTAFTIPQGLFGFNVIPFGLTNARQLSKD